MQAPDESVIDHVVAQFYSAFDNRSGRMPDERALRELLSHTASITRITNGVAETWIVDEFIEPRMALLTGGSLREFHEWEVAGSTTVRGFIASRWSEYEKRGILDGADFRGAGRKLIHLHRAGESWVISSVLWEDSDD